MRLLFLEPKNSCTGWTKRPKCWPSPPEFLEFFSTKPTHVLQKKFSGQILGFLTNFKVKLVACLESNQKIFLLFCCKPSQNFKSLISSPSGWYWNDFYSLSWKLHLKISILQLLRGYQSRCDQVWAWFRELLLHFTIWYINQADCMHV